MTMGYAEDSGNTESTADDDGDDTLQDELEGELKPTPPATATEEPDKRTVADADDGDEMPSSPGAG